MVVGHVPFTHTLYVDPMEISVKVWKIDIEKDCLGEKLEKMLGSSKLSISLS